MAKVTKRSFLRDYPDNFLRCRIGHDFDFMHEGNFGFGSVQIQVCPRCMTEKTEVWNTRGEVVERSYDYSDGYVDTHHLQLCRGDFRAELVRRAIARQQHASVGAGHSA